MLFHTPLRFAFSSFRPFVFLPRDHREGAKRRKRERRKRSKCHRRSCGSTPTMLLDSLARFVWHCLPQKRSTLGRGQHCLRAFQFYTSSGKQCFPAIARPIACSASSATPPFRQPGAPGERRGTACRRAGRRPRGVNTACGLWGSPHLPPNPVFRQSPGRSDVPQAVSHRRKPLRQPGASGETHCFVFVGSFAYCQRVFFPLSGHSLTCLASRLKLNACVVGAIGTCPAGCLSSPCVRSLCS